MNRIEYAVATADLMPLVVEEPASPIAAVVAAFFAGAAFGFAVGFGLHNLGGEEYADEIIGEIEAAMLAEPSGAELVAARRDAIAADLMTAARP